MTRNFFKKLDKVFDLPPFAVGANVFCTKDYEQETSCSHYSAKERLRKLVQRGMVRKVRTLVDGRVTQAWEYLGAGENAD